MSIRWTFGEVILKAMADEEDNRRRKEALEGEKENRLIQRQLDEAQLKQQEKVAAHSMALEDKKMGMAEEQQTLAKLGMQLDQEERVKNRAMADRKMTLEEQVAKAQMSAAGLSQSVDSFKLAEMKRDSELVTAEEGLPADLVAGYREKQYLPADFWTRKLSRREWNERYTQPQTAEYLDQKGKQSYVAQLSKSAQEAVDKVQLPGELVDTSRGIFDVFRYTPDEADKDLNKRKGEFTKQANQLTATLPTLIEAGQVVDKLSTETGDVQKMKPWLDKASMAIRHFQEIKRRGGRLSKEDADLYEALNVRYINMYDRLRTANAEYVSGLLRAAESEFYKKQGGAAGAQSGKVDWEEIRQSMITK